MNAQQSSQFYSRLIQQMQALIGEEQNLIANLANVSALLNLELEEINWVGFYLLEEQQLVLGPFQGNPACIRIELGKGVCGTAARQDKVQRVEDVHQFVGHIACDARSNSEIVLPLHRNGELIGVLDIDSPKIARFSQDDENGLIKLVNQLEKLL